MEDNKNAYIRMKILTKMDSFRTRTKILKPMKEERLWIRAFEKKYCENLEKNILKNGYS